MTTTEDPINTVATKLRGAVDKAVDLMDSNNLHSIGDAGYEAASRVLAGAPDLKARLDSAPVDLNSLRVSAARRGHELARSLDDRAQALAPRKPSGHRWYKWLLILGLVGAAAFYLNRRLTHGKAPSQRDNAPSLEMLHDDVTAKGSPSEAAPGEPHDAVASSPDSKGSRNGAPSKKTEAQ
jgi:hypothetical protein